MDSLLASGSHEETLSHSHSTPFSNEEVLEEQVAISNGDTQPALRDRISSAKVYLLSDSAPTRTAKVR